jgi:threonine/homoserine/homoserine lactone efflux protein
MRPDLFLALLSFCFVATITPGPNNMMLLASGVTYGFKRTIPHMLGITSGVAVMALMLGLSMAGIAQHLPRLYAVLHVVSTLYLLWLAWRIATSAGPGSAGRNGRPMNTVEGILFQWVNPKAWAMVLGAITSFTRPEHLLADLPIVVGTFLTVGLPCNMVWAGTGATLQSMLREPRTLRIFNVAMAAILVISILPGLRELL